MDKGFTLIELLVVVLIIGILSAVALPQYQKTVNKARATEMINYASTWKKAQNIYRLETGSYTSYLDDLSIKMPELKYFTVGSANANMLIVRPGSTLSSLPISEIHFGLSGDDGTMYGCCIGEASACKEIMPCAGRTTCSL